MWFVPAQGDLSMLTGAHSIIYSTNAQADREFLRDVLKLTHVDVGDGWLIFGLPPAEVAVHPANKGKAFDFYLMFDNIAAFVTEMERRHIVCGPVTDEGWGLLSYITLPGGGRLGIYQPRHARPKPMLLTTTTSRNRMRSVTTAARRKARSATRKTRAQGGN
jgi:hypothetical protein